MKAIYFIAAFSLFARGMVGQEVSGRANRLETFMDCWKAGVVEIRAEGMYVEPRRFSVIQNELMLLSDKLEWIPVNESLRESLGVATIEDYREECRVNGWCLRQHVGFFWSPKWRLWFCLNECPYNFYKNFPNGKGE
jgi:hypothetical protein